MSALLVCGVEGASSRWELLPRCSSVLIESLLQSVFLSDIAFAYTKNHELESLLFDDFFTTGMSLALMSSTSSHPS